MIISENSEYYRMITQNDHGDLAGQFAAHWGNGPFAKLNPYQPMVLAAEAHDNGWWDWDSFHRQRWGASHLHANAARIQVTILR